MGISTPLFMDHHLRSLSESAWFIVAAYCWYTAGILQNSQNTFIYYTYIQYKSLNNAFTDANKLFQESNTIFEGGALIISYAILSKKGGFCPFRNSNRVLGVFAEALLLLQCLDGF